MHEKMVKVE